jgi:hypothetical protein
MLLPMPDEQLEGKFGEKSLFLAMAGAPLIVSTYPTPPAYYKLYADHKDGDKYGALLGMKI